HLRDGLPQPPLRHRQQRPPALRTDPLIMLRLALDLVAVAELALDRDKILDVHLRGEFEAAAAALRLLALRRHLLVEADADVGRTLEDVEELAEWQPEQREDDRDR